MVANAKASKKDLSPTGRASTKDASSSRRKSPARNEKPKSPSRATVKTPPPSPSRKSPSRRSPARKSPSRKSPVRKSPTRRSPGRPPKADKEKQKESDSLHVNHIPTRRSPGRPPKADKEKQKESASKSRKQVIDVDSDSDVDLKTRMNSEKPKAAVRGRARKLDADFTSPKDIHAVKDVSGVDRDISSYVGLVRRSVQKPQARDLDRIVHLRSNDASVKKLTEFSDEDEVPAVRSSFVKEKSERYSEPKVIEDQGVKTKIGGWIGALVPIFVVPLSIVSLFVICNEKQCSFTKLPNFEKYKLLSSYIDTKALATYSGFVSLIAVLSALPFAGSKVSGLPNKQGKLNYVMNGLFIALVTGLMLAALEFYNVPVISIILKKHFQLVISSLILGCVFSIYLYAHSFFVPVSALNPYAISNNGIYNFFMGKELNPRILLGRTDVKLFLLRVYVIGMILMNAILVYKNIEFSRPADVKETTFDLKSLKFNPTLLVLATLQIIHCFDYLIFESGFVTTFSAQYEGVGYLLSTVFIPGPFIFTIASKYIFDNKVQLPAWQLAVAALIFLIGQYLARRSDNQKNAFRQNPYSPALSHLESIPTSQGKKLLVSGYWGFVRHPNYLGAILILLSYSLFVLNVPAVGVYLGNIALLIQRAHLDGVRCKQRYGTAWDRYCQRVKYVLIPKVY